MFSRTGIFTISYFSALLLNIVGAETGQADWAAVTKPLLMPLLITLLLAETRGKASADKRLLFAALFFSWAGDLLLMFQENKSLFFLLGLSAFLVAHLFYIVLFHRIRIRGQLAPRQVLLWTVVLYYVLLLSWLSPYLGALQWPVRIYGIVISTMLLLALHLAWLNNRAVAVRLLCGAALFVVSDSLLAVNKFILPLPVPTLLIMLTYGTAQYLLTVGLIKYLRAGAR